VSAGTQTGSVPRRATLRNATPQSVSVSVSVSASASASNTVCPCCSGSPAQGPSEREVAARTPGETEVQEFRVVPGQHLATTLHAQGRPLLREGERIFSCPFLTSPPWFSSCSYSFTVLTNLCKPLHNTSWRFSSCNVRRSAAVSPVAACRSRSVRAAWTSRSAALQWPPARWSRTCSRCLWCRPQEPSWRTNRCVWTLQRGRTPHGNPRSASWRAAGRAARSGATVRRSVPARPTLFRGSEVLTAANMKIAVFWDVAQCCLVDIDRRFKGALFLHHQEGSGLLWNVGRCL
jgi:hypothetical protein